MPGIRPPQPGGAVPRPVALLDQIKRPQVETLEVEPPEGMVASGNVIMTDKGWQPVFVDRKRITG
jgi:hypothetical protein